VKWKADKKNITFNTISSFAVFCFNSMRPGPNEIRNKLSFGTKQKVKLTFLKVLMNSYTIRKGVLFSVRIQVQYQKSVKNDTFSSTNHDFFFEINIIFDSKKKEHL
jgi:hypothetical protein